MTRMEEENTTEENSTHKNAGKRPIRRPRTRWMDQIRTDIEMRRENLEETQENRRWENRDSWKKRILRKCYTQKWRENNQEEDPEPDG